MQLLGAYFLKSVEDVRNIPDNRRRDIGVTVLATERFYYYVSDSVASDDGDVWLKPNSIAPSFEGRGRWKGVALGVAGVGGASPLTTKGDLYTFDSADARLPVGANGNILQADSGEPTGLKWAAAPGGSYSPPIPQSDVANLVSDLADLASDIAGKADVSHTHPESDVTGLIADLAAKEATANKGAASGYASLNPASKVVEDPANATAVPTASKIVIASAGGKVDSWVSDADASTKGLIKLASSLAGTAALPQVAAIDETSGPTKLVIGSIPDGYLAKRVGGTLVGVDPATLVGASEADIRLGKPFFIANSQLPATTYLEELHTMPAPDFSNLNSGVLSRVKGGIKYTTSGTNVHNFGWDLGGLKSKVLFIMCGVKTRLYGVQMFFGNTAPSSSDLSDGSYMVSLDINSNSTIIYKRASGTYTALVTDATWSFLDSYSGTPHDVALYYDDATGEITGYLRVGMESWVQVVTITDSTFTTMRYVGFRIQSNPSLVTRMSTPMAIYYTT